MTKNFGSLEHQHDPESIQKRILSNSTSLLRDLVYGAIDGAVTTFAIVAGVAGANLQNRTVLILGFANIVADGFSMAASNYLASKSELEEKRIVSLYEQQQMEVNPQGEAEEVRQIFLNKGITGEDLENLVQKIISNKTEWLKIMLAEEYGYSSREQKPWKAGLTTFTSFLLFGLIPLTPYMLKLPESFTYAILLTGTAFFAAGAMKSRWTKDSFWRSGIETLAVGSLTALLAYLVGVYLGG